MSHFARKNVRKASGVENVLKESVRSTYVCRRSARICSPEFISLVMNSTVLS